MKEGGRIRATVVGGVAALSLVIAREANTPNSKKIDASSRRGPDPVAASMWNQQLQPVPCGDLGQPNCWNPNGSEVGFYEAMCNARPGLVVESGICVFPSTTTTTAVAAEAVPLKPDAAPSMPVVGSFQEEAPTQVATTIARRSSPTSTIADIQPRVSVEAVQPAPVEPDPAPLIEPEPEKRVKPQAVDQPSTMLDVNGNPIVTKWPVITSAPNCGTLYEAPCYDREAGSSLGYSPENCHQGQPVDGICVPAAENPANRWDLVVPTGPATFDR